MKQQKTIKADQKGSKTMFIKILRTRKNTKINRLYSGFFLSDKLWAKYNQ